MTDIIDSHDAASTTDAPSKDGRASSGSRARSGGLNAKLMPLHSSLFVEANPIPVKWALGELGWIHNELRLPLTPLSPRHHDTVRRALREAGCVARPATKVYS